MLYRIFTENKNYDQIKELICQHFDGCTLIKAKGVWQGKSEHSLIIEIDYIKPANVIDVDIKIDQLCYAIKKLNQQNKILVQRIESNSKLI